MWIIRDAAIIAGIASPSSAIGDANAIPPWREAMQAKLSEIVTEASAGARRACRIAVIGVHLNPRQRIAILPDHRARDHPLRHQKQFDIVDRLPCLERNGLAALSWR